ncbi:hypothetical protein CDAR_183801 [Caerostris darwini]|uniref:Uncharacterized protein n=1 Tax=Caerostris darwini TaxID=1538125 RepID=A0AAV4TYB1_9ARAC|nr:hypothetical protein CDAR_183801 [Caerostris darwini]
MCSLPQIVFYNYCADPRKRRFWDRHDLTIQLDENFFRDEKCYFPSAAAKNKLNKRFRSDPLPNISLAEIKREKLIDSQVEDIQSQKLFRAASILAQKLKNHFIATRRQRSDFVARAFPSK